MFAAATSFFARTAISQSYNIGGPGGSRSSTPGPGATSSSSAISSISSALLPAVLIGLWKVQTASNKVTGKKVSVWSFDKRGPEMERLGPLAKDHVLEVMKAEASALTRLRHPSILEMVEPMEETRNEIVFATEPIIASLEQVTPGLGRYTALVELDEVEIQKGILQICRGLSFLHSSAQLIHSNLSPNAIIINSAGDWKMSGLGLTIPLLQPNGSATRWEFPMFDGRAPHSVQRSFDYMAPEYALDESLQTQSDMYSLGAIIYAVHSKGAPPFRTHGSLSGLRDAMNKGIGSIQGMQSLDPDLQDLLTSLLTRISSTRPTPITLPSHAFFSSLPISTLNFLDRQNFTSKSREEKIGFMKGLTSVLDRFSEGLRTRKILPSLLEEMKDTNLLPYILPNVFAISNTLSSSQFAAQVLPSLKPLFSVKDPPQNMLTLLENLEMLQSKTDMNVFRTDVLPLVYNSLDSEHAPIQERALKAIPGLCDTIDYAEVQNVIFPRVALVFTKTRVLTVKIATLTTFLAMVKTLDQNSLTKKLVPLLSKIRTKEPAVMMATLSVQEAMGMKVDREAVATLVLPQLWTMSIGPLLSVGQFQRFMSVIKILSERVEKEHNQFLRDAQRLEDRSAIGTSNGTTTSVIGTVDFQTLVAGGNGTIAIVTNDIPTLHANKSWDDDVWGSIFNDDTSRMQTSTTAPLSSSSSVPMIVQSLPSSPRVESFHPRPSRLGALRVSSINSPSVSPSSMSPPLRPAIPQSVASSISSIPALRPTTTGSSASSSSYPSFHSTSIPQPQKPNYNVSLEPATMSQPMNLMGTSQPVIPFSTPPLAAPTLGMSVLAPTKPATPSWNANKPPSNIDWGDFDPLA